MHKTIRVLLALLAVALPFAAWSQSYPSRPIRIIIPFPPGNTLDVMTRLIAPRLIERLGQNIIVDNRAGASGMLGLEIAAKSHADGYTLVGGQGGNLIIASHTYKNVPYDPIKDFTPIAVSTTNFLGLAIHPRVPFRNMKDLVSYAKANPGKLSFGTGGQFVHPHMTIEMLRVMSGFTYLQVPYKGTNEAVSALLGGEVDAVVAGITGLATHVQAGRLRLLAVTAPTRTQQYPDVPAIAETVPGFESSGFFGYLGPAGLPQNVVTLLNEEINRAMGSPDIKEKLNAVGLIVIAESPEYFRKMIQSDYEKYGKLIRDIGLRAQ